MMTLNLLDHPVVLSTPRRLTGYSAWCEHIPFAMFLVDLLRPRTIVELGAHYGDSFCAFCQAVDELGLQTACYAVDTWRGDEHAGFYGPEVLADLRAHHDPLYGSFSRLVHSTFDEACEHFPSGSIDLLHIDGFHSYEAVKHDFETWQPKLSHRGVVLFHDTNVREHDFGVYKFWAEVSESYSHFEFHHGHGLGVLAVGKESHENLSAVLDLRESEAVAFRRFFFQLGYLLTEQIVKERALTDARKQSRELAELLAQNRELTELLAQKETVLSTLRCQIEEKDRAIEERGRTIEERDQAIGEKARAIEEKARAIEEKDRAIEEKALAIEERGRTIEEKDRVIEEKDRVIETLYRQIMAITNSRGGKLLQRWWDLRRKISG